MKKSIISSVALIGILLLKSCVTAQIQQSPPPMVANFENEIDKNANYVLANEWMVESFNDAKSVIQFTDKESGTIKGKYLLKSGGTTTDMWGIVSSTPELYAIITMRVRDNACRIEIDPPSSGFYSAINMGTETGYTTLMFDEDARNLINSFQKRMNGLKTSSDW